MALLGIILGVFCLLFLLVVILHNVKNPNQSKGDTDAK